VRKLLAGMVLLGSTLGGGFFKSSQAVELVCVSGNQLLQESQFAQKIKQQLQQKRNQLIEEFKKKAQELQEKMKKLQEEVTSGLLSKEEREKKEKQLEELNKQLQMLQIQTQQQIMAYTQQQLQLLDKLAKEAIKALSQSLGFKAAIDCTQLLYYDKSIDITPQVAKILDQMAKEAGKLGPAASMLNETPSINQALPPLGK